MFHKWKIDNHDDFDSDKYLNIFVNVDLDVSY